MLKAFLLAAWFGVLALGSWLALAGLSRLWGQWDMEEKTAWKMAFLAAMGVSLILAWVIAMR